jgi:hypothetical protein
MLSLSHLRLHQPHRVDDASEVLPVRSESGFQYSWPRAFGSTGPESLLRPRMTSRLPGLLTHNSTQVCTACICRTVTYNPQISSLALHVASDPARLFYALRFVRSPRRRPFSNFFSCHSPLCPEETCFIIF